jgi:hypothetical protein
MQKNAALLLLIFALLITACSPALKSELVPMAPAGDAYLAEEGYFAAPMEAEISRQTGAGAPSVASDAQRIVIMNANLSISVADPAETMKAIAQMAEEMGGFVVSSELFQTRNQSGQQFPQARITVRVPASRLNEAMETIMADASEVLSENSTGQDVTREYTDLQSRLRNFEDAEAQLREIMGSATKTEDVLNVFNQLTYIREQIEVVKGQIQYYEQAAALSAISVNISADAALQPLTIGGWQPVGVARDALQSLINSLQWLATAIIWIVIGLLPVLLIIFVPLYLIFRSIRRWRRNRKAARAIEAEEK